MQASDNHCIYAVVLHYKNEQDTINCVHSLKKCSYKNLRIIIVENYSQNGSGEIIKSTFPELNVIDAAENRGYAGGMNIGARYAVENGADYVLLLNNDMLFEPGFIEPLVGLSLSDPMIGIVSPKVLYMHDKNKIYCAGGEYIPFRCGGVNMYRGMETDKFGNEIREISSAEGSCLLVKREIFDKGIYFDESFFMYFEDLDFSLKVRKYFKIMYNPKSIVYHKAGAGVQWSNFTPLYYYYFTRNRLLFFRNAAPHLKAYALLYTFFNSTAKVMILLINYFKQNKNNKFLESIASIYKGARDGIKKL